MPSAHEGSIMHACVCLSGPTSWSGPSRTQYQMNTRTHKYMDRFTVRRRCRKQIWITHIPIPATQKHFKLVDIATTLQNGCASHHWSSVVRTYMRILQAVKAQDRTDHTTPSSGEQTTPLPPVVSRPHHSPQFSPL